MKSIEERVKKMIESHSMLQSDDKVIVALSGGADSVSLLLLLSSLGYECHAAHCNFHLRAEESMRDEDFARNLCERHRIPFHKVDFDTTSYAKEHGISIEMAARDLRYDYFRKLKTELKAAAIAVGHHKDDNIETMLLNMVRGTGIQGLCGIQPVNGYIIRPLLDVSREDILSYLKELNQNFVTDSTNLQDEYSRNKVRLNIIPELKSINPAASDNIITTINNLNEVKKIYLKAVHEDIKRCSRQEGNALYITKQELLKCTSPSTILHELLFPLGFNSSQEMDIQCNIEAEHIGKIFYSKTHILTIDREDIIVSPNLEDSDFCTPLQDSKRIEITETTIDHLHISKSKDTAYLDKGKIKGNMYVRPCKPGDSFQPFGMTGRKLLSDYMTDRKFNRIQKKNQLVLCDSDGEIAWVIGERVSEKYKIDTKTTHIIVLHII